MDITQCLQTEIQKYTEDRYDHMQVSAAYLNEDAFQRLIYCYFEFHRDSC